MGRIAILSIDLAGHLGPALRLGATLAGGGHEVLVWAPARHRERIESFGGAHVAQEQPRFAYPWSGFPEFAVRQAQTAAESLPGLLERMLHARIDLVIYDTQTPWGRLAADCLGLPRAVSNPLYPMWAVDGLPPVAPAPVEADRWIGEHAALRGDLLQRWGVDLRSPAETIASAEEWTISYTAEPIIGPRDPPAGWCLAGPLMDPVAPAAPTGRPFVYAALGTFWNRSREPFGAIVEGLATLDVDALISTGGLPPEQLGPLPSNITVSTFVDSRAMLSRAAVHVTHGGASSVHESLIAGVPMVCLPLGSDQEFWAARVAERGAGLSGSYDPHWIAEAVVRQLSAEPRIAAELVGRELARHPGSARVLTLVDMIFDAEFPAGELSSSADPG